MSDTSEAVRRIKAEALREAAEHFDRYDVVTIEATDIGSNQVPVEPAVRLRQMADELDDRLPARPASPQSPASGEGGGAG